MGGGGKSGSSTPLVGDYNPLLTNSLPSLLFLRVTFVACVLVTHRTRTGTCQWIHWLPGVVGIQGLELGPKRWFQCQGYRYSYSLSLGILVFETGNVHN